MTNVQRIQRKQALREAEGYLDLVMVLSDRFPLSDSLRDRLAERTLHTLDAFGSFGPREAHGMYLRGQAYRVMEDYPKAIEALKASSEADRESLHTWLALGWCYKRAGQLDFAIQSLEEALAVDPSAAIVYYNLACYWSLAKSPRLAVDYLSEAFAIDPEYRDLVADERDFDPIRNDPDFKMLTSTLV